eukprot:1160492-Pelagomonas_calceolata.AAC.10
MQLSNALYNSKSAQHCKDGARMQQAGCSPHIIPRHRVAQPGRSLVRVACHGGVSSPHTKTVVAQPSTESRVTSLALSLAVTRPTCECGEAVLPANERRFPSPVSAADVMLASLLLHRQGCMQALSFFPILAAAPIKLASFLLDAQIYLTAHGRLCTYGCMQASGWDLSLCTRQAGSLPLCIHTHISLSMQALGWPPGLATAPVKLAPLSLRIWKYAGVRLGSLSVRMPGWFSAIAHPYNCVFQSKCKQISVVAQMDARRLQVGFPVPNQQRGVLDRNHNLIEPVSFTTLNMTAPAPYYLHKHQC